MSPGASAWYWMQWEKQLGYLRRRICYIGLCPPTTPWITYLADGPAWSWCGATVNSKAKHDYCFLIQQSTHTQQQLANYKVVQHWKKCAPKMRHIVHSRLQNLHSCYNIKTITRHNNIFTLYCDSGMQLGQIVLTQHQEQREWEAPLGLRSPYLLHNHLFFKQRVQSV